MPRITKEDLMNKNDILRESNLDLKSEMADMRDRDEYLRKEFSKVIGDDFFEQSGIPPFEMNRCGKDPKLLSWEEIFFKIGELNADANYSCVIASKNELRNELEKLRQKDEEK